LAGPTIRLFDLLLSEVACYPKVGTPEVGALQIRALKAQTTRHYQGEYSLQHVSQELGLWTIANMLELTSGISGTDRRKRLAQHLHQCVFGTGCRLT
jgi:hypothetical protein